MLIMAFLWAIVSGDLYLNIHISDDISGSAPYYGLCEKAPPKCGTFFTIQEYELIWKVKDLTSCSIQLKGSNRCSLWL